MNMTYYRLELRRLRRDYVTMFFTAGLPAFMYVIFGASQEYSDDPVRDGNVAMLVMIGMAAYGAVSATTGIGGTVAVERMQGWSRQLGLTPLTDGAYVRVKTATALTVAAVPIVLVYAIGAATGAKAPLSVWLISAAILLVGATTFALYGLSFGLGFRSEAATAAAGGSLVILGFLGNVFIPLTGWQLTVAKFNPMYGYVALGRAALTGGSTIDPDGGGLIHVPLWQPLANMIVWTIILSVVAVALVGRGRARQ